MTKIKNFRISLKARDIARGLKARQNGALDPALESSLEPQIPALKARIRPASVYATLPKALAVKTVAAELPSKAVALSLIVATVGSGLREDLAQAEASQDAARVLLLDVAEQEALQQAVAFALRLVQEQAKNEDCELLEPVVVHDNDHLLRYLPLLGVERIGLSTDQQPLMWPPYARLLTVTWMPKAKAASKKSPSKPRLEKAAL